MFNQILVPLDGSAEAARALRPAKLIADRLDVSLHAVAFHDPHTDGRELDALVRLQLTDIGPTRCRVDVDPLNGSVAEMLAPHLEDEAALVVMSTRGHGRSASLVGSVGTDILRRSRGPVLLIGPNCEVESFTLTGPFVVAADAGDGVDVTVELAASVARGFGLDPMVVNVVDPKSQRLLASARSGPRGEDVPPESAMVHRFAAVLEHELHREVNFKVVHASHAGAAIADYAAELSATLIVMSTHARSGFRRLVLGSVTAATVTDARCPVLAIVPPAAAVDSDVATDD